jgi:hypothetical protein
MERVMAKVHTWQDLSDGAIACRAFSHAWTAHTATPGRSKEMRKNGYWVVLICSRGCGTEKHFFLSKDGEYSRSTFRYTGTYLMDHALSAEEKGQIKLDAVLDGATVNGLRLVQE